MGYSLSVLPRNDQLSKRMLRFMKKNYRKWSNVLGFGPESISTGEFTDNVSYGAKKACVGFDYASHCHGWERAYVYCVIRWIALKIGRKQSKFKRDSGPAWKFPEPVPYIRYDGIEEWPILLVANEREAKKTIPTKRWCCVDKFGVYISAEINESLTSMCEKHAPGTRNF